MGRQASISTMPMAVQTSGLRNKGASGPKYVALYRSMHQIPASSSAVMRRFRSRREKVREKDIAWRRRAAGGSGSREGYHLRGERRAGCGEREARSYGPRV